MKINFIEKRSEKCYQASVESEDGQCFVFDFPHEPLQEEIENIFNNTIQQTVTE